MDMTETWCPLGDEHCAILTALLQSCAETGQCLDRLEKAGLDVSHWRAKNDHQMQTGSALKQAFFPGRP